MNTVFKALSDPTRREVLTLLRDGPRSAGELSAEFNVSKPTMSAHFAVLREAGLVRSEKQGKAVIYQLQMSVLEDALFGFTNMFGLSPTMAGSVNATPGQRVMNMIDNSSNQPAARVLTVAILAVMSALAVIVVGKESGWLDPGIARRGVSASLGVLLVVCGNYLPKLTRKPDGDTALLGRADRAGGRILLLTGLAFSAIWLLAPLATATAIASIIGLVGAFAAIGVWTWTARRASGGSARLAITATDTAVRAAVAMIMLSIFVTFGIFEIDRIWGDQAAQWSAIIFSMMIVFGGSAPVVTTLFRRD